MKQMLLVPALAAVAVTIGAQTPVSARAQQKEVRAQTGQVRTTGEALRALKLEIDGLVVLNTKNDSMWRMEVERKGDPLRMQSLLDEMERVAWPLFAKQSQLALACADLRSQQGPFAGWIGVAFEKPAEFTKIEGERITVNFFGKPRVAEIEAGSPAALAGVQSGDEWLALNGRTIDDSVEFNELDKPGTSLAIRTARVGKLLELNVVVGKRPFPEDACGPLKRAFVYATPLIVAPPGPQRVSTQRGGVGIVRVPVAPSRIFVTIGQINFGGAVLKTLDDDQRAALEVRDGVLVSEVGPRTPAAAAGIKSLDVVLVVNGTRVNSLLDFERAMRAEPVLTLTVQRKGREVLLKMPAK